MKTKKFKGFIVTNEIPKKGDTIVCIDSKSRFYGSTEVVTHFQVKNKTVDTKNWKIVVNIEERKETIVDDVIESLKEDMAHGDYTVLDELLKMIPDKNLIQALSEEQWSKYSEIKLEK